MIYTVFSINDYIGYKMLELKLAKICEINIQV